MRALIVEDEPVAARGLQRLLAVEAPDLDARAVVGSVAAAIEWLQREPRPDVLFLDIQLGDGLSFDIFDACPVDVPVVFVTAHDEFALRAFEVHGIDYLLKPVDPVRLRAALARLRRLAPTAAPVPLPAVAGDYREATRQYRQRFLVQAGSRMQALDAGDVAYFSKELVVRLVARDGRGYALAQSLDDVQRGLDPDGFFRLNRQVLAARSALCGVRRLGKGRLEVDLQPPLPEPVVVSQERAAAFRAWFGG